MKPQGPEKNKLILKEQLWQPPRRDTSWSKQKKSVWI